MRLTILAFLLAFAAPDDKDALKKAQEKAVGLTSYLVQWNERYTLRGGERTQGGAFEYLTPDLMTFKSGTIDIVKKKDAAMVNTKDGWVKTDDDPRSKRLAANLKPFHESLPAILDKIDAPRKGKDTDHNKIKCAAYAGTLSSDALKDALNAYVTRQSLPVRGIDWVNSKLNVEILVSRKDGWIEKITIKGDLKTTGKNSSTAPYERVIEFFDHNKTQPRIDPEVKKALGIEDSK